MHASELNTLMIFTQTSQAIVNSLFGALQDFPSGTEGE
jgi:hypothetical protein